MVLRCYSNLFWLNPLAGRDFIKNRFHVLNVEDKLKLSSVYKEEEIINTMMEMRPLKSRGPDGLQQSFIKKHGK